MRALLRCTLPLGQAFYRCESSSNGGSSSVKKMVQLARVWRAFPLRAQPLAAPQTFSISRNQGMSYVEDLKRNLGISPGCPNVVYRRPPNPLHLIPDYFRRMWSVLNANGAREDLPTREDLIAGAHRVFDLCMEAIERRDFEMLNEYALNPVVMRQLNVVLETLDLHDEQLRIFETTRQADLVGDDGFIFRWKFMDNANLIVPYASSVYTTPRDPTGVIVLPLLVYRVELLAMFNKEMVFRELSNYSKDPQPRVKMPPEYGFDTPRYVLVAIDFVHKSVYDESRKVMPFKGFDDEALIYDLHVHSF